MTLMIPVLSFLPRFSDVWYLITQDVASSLPQYIPPMYRNRTHTDPVQKKKHTFFITRVNNIAITAT